MTLYSFVQLMWSVCAMSVVFFCQFLVVPRGGALSKQGVSQHSDFNDDGNTERIVASPQVVKSACELVCRGQSLFTFCLFLD